MPPVKSEVENDVPNALPALQPRSIRTRDRLLDAAEALLAAGGPDAATVPAIARRARVAVGSVYRRFPDKDAVLRAVYERFFQRSIDGNRQALEAGRWMGMPLPDLVAALVRGMVRGYVQQRALLAALLRYADTHADAAFRRHAEALRDEAFRMIGALLLARREEIGHPEPERAIEFSLLTIALVLKGLVLGGDWPGSGVTTERVTRELSRVTVSYLRG
jgi:AcrR family transcriptional regulator